MDLNNRWFNSQPIHAELSPVTDFREACCRQYEMGYVSLLHTSLPILFLQLGALFCMKILAIYNSLLADEAAN